VPAPMVEVIAALIIVSSRRIWRLSVPKKFVSPESFRSALRAGHVLPTQNATSAEPQLKGGRKIRFVFSNSDVDRMGDTLDPASWQLSEYLKNPVVL
jgi:hypothetical protein